jgi:hypothetical protein
MAISLTLITRTLPVIDQDYKKFKFLVTAVAEMFRHPMTPAQLNFWWEDLRAYDYALVERAFQIARNTSKFMPTVAAIMEQLPDPLGHLAPEEAWNRLPKTESESGYVTHEMSLSRGACQDSIDRGDLVGARMAYIESYRKAVASARVRGERAKFWYSGGAGGTFEQRRLEEERLTIEAVERGWLTRERATQILPGICSELGKESMPLIARICGESSQKYPQLGNGLKKTEKSSNAISDALALIVQSTKIPNEPTEVELLAKLKTINLPI